nr:hypothetical protein [Tanacetum cinerariifolium]
MGNPDITMEEYIQLEEEKAQRQFPDIVFNDTLISEQEVPPKPTVSPRLTKSNLKSDSGNDDEIIDLKLDP